jgi:hypothetical protein
VAACLDLAKAGTAASYVALFYQNNRLYQVEGDALVAEGQAEVDAMRFQQSLDLTQCLSQIARRGARNVCTRWKHFLTISCPRCAFTASREIIRSEGQRDMSYPRLRE